MATRRPVRAQPPHRAFEFNEPCRECRSLAPAVCPRCQRPLCPEHLPEPERRCEACEEQFTSLAEEARSELGTVKNADAAVVGGGVGLAAAAAATAAALLFWDRLELVLLVMVMIGTPLAHVIGGPMIRVMRARRTRIEERRMAGLRRDFLTERVPLAPLPPSHEEG